MAKRLCALIWALVCACAPSAHVRVLHVAPWVPAAYCVVADEPVQALELGALVTRSLAAWDVMADVFVGTWEALPSGWPCVAISFVDRCPSGADEHRLAVTELTASGPVSIVIEREFWAACPDARLLLVQHEVGHSVGYVGHDAEGLAMGEHLECRPLWVPLPTDEEKSRAADLRTHGFQLQLE